LQRSKTGGTYNVEGEKKSAMCVDSKLTKGGNGVVWVFLFFP